ncbi:coniferyl aldehyde dehydrogenase [Acinetobacter brisouii]|uniref:coniferyl aldehyde dehydrogenase n=1 Tax=Acinetobacter brisouii TaxID=396323 RepID=UPI00124F0A0F|nr:coniferyl aldehyde dehydrogenase [Acinetobacter brisouii]
MDISTLQQRLAAMRQAHTQAAPASLELRHDRLERAKKLLLENREALIAAISADFGHRSAYQSLVSDILASVAALSYAQEQLAEWTQPEIVAAPYAEMRTEIHQQPLGVVGIISPWNFPLNLAFSPLAGVFAAGNRALIKPSELTPKTAELLAELVPQYFDALELGVVTGDAEVGAAFSALPFDHLVFTGSSQVGRHVMRAAAENLVPVTLELGGKSPVVIAPDAKLEQAVQRILTVKTFNAGQICISPDYVLLPEQQQQDFVTFAQQFMAESFNHFQDNPDYTAIINPRHYQRLMHVLEDAQAKGATLIPLTAHTQDATHEDARRKIVPTLVLNVSDDMLVMQEEIFGPILPIKTYQQEQQAIDYINAHPRPLAAYYFSEDAVAQQYFAERTTSGALVVNDVMTHVVIETLPFGGVGASGIGAYHGVHGFRRFSHAKPIVVQSPQGESNLRLRAPYAAAYQQLQDMLNPAQE